MDSTQPLRQSQARELAHPPAERAEQRINEFCLQLAAILQRLLKEQAAEKENPS